MAAGKYVVARTTDIVEGGRILVEVNGRSIGIFKVDGEYYGLLNRCPHAGGEMCKGDIVGALDSPRPGVYRFDATHKLLTCPWHGWEFDIKTGQSYIDPQRTRLRSYAVEVEGGPAVASGLDSGDVGVGTHDGDATRGMAPSRRTGPSGRLAGPYQAETISVTVEDDYLVVNTRPARPGPDSLANGTTDERRS